LNPASQTFRRDGARGSRRRQCAWLTWALSCEHPLAPTARWPLDEIDEVVFSRGRASTSEIVDGRLVVRLADRSVSATHARLLQHLGGWTLEDAGSTNGSFVNDSRVERVRLGDGDRVEIGHNFFVFRAALPVEAPPLRADVPGLATWSPVLGARFAELLRVALSEVPIVLLGESGTGKELMARAAHQLSARKGPFVPVNCGALPTTLVQSELFGYKRGAFSGADEDRPGLVRAADRGTLFLDEIGDLPLASQAALLRVLQEREVTPLGATKPIAVDVRVVAATHRDLEALVAAKQFREDLLARLSGWTLRLPPLRERMEDLGLLTARLIAPSPRSPVTLTWEAARALMRYRWPLNVRELQKCLSTALVLSGGAIDVAHLPPALTAAPSAAAAPADGSLSPEDRQRRDELRALLESERGNVAAVARALGKAPVQIRRWARRFNLDPGQFRR
jgi:sigma-54 dependent transcriptional regulator, acetoin dehydrogenase operon transcriptional activator AcoR